MDDIGIADGALQRNLAWVRAADSKVPSAFAVDAAMLGVLGLRLPSLDQLAALPAMLWGLAAVCLIASLIALGLVVLPRLGGPKDSVVFFGTATALKEGAYVERLLDTNRTHLAQDMARQAYRNAEIAQMKYNRLLVAFWLMFIAVPFWVAALIATRNLPG